VGELNGLRKVRGEDLNDVLARCNGATKALGKLKADPSEKPVSGKRIKNIPNLKTGEWATEGADDTALEGSSLRQQREKGKKRDLESRSSARCSFSTPTKKTSKERQERCVALTSTKMAAIHPMEN